MNNVPETIKYFMEVEKTAAEILSQKEQIFNLHKRLNETREALSEVTKSNIDKSYMYSGPLLIKQSREEIISRLKVNFKELNEEIKTKGAVMKELVFKLQDIEKEQPYSGRKLVPLDQEELNALNQVWGSY